MAAPRRKVDAEIIVELSRTTNAFFDYLKWLCERRDFEAIEKLKPVIERITKLLQTPFGDNLRETELLVGVLNRLYDEIDETVAKTKTGHKADRQKMAPLAEEVQKAWEEFLSFEKAVQAELAKQEAKIKSRKH